MSFAFVTGLDGVVLNPDERRFLRDSLPAGLILFGRNCQTSEQMRRLIGEAREAIGENETLVMIDQEGGRVQRMAPPEWPAYPAPARLGRLYEHDPEDAIATAKRVAWRLAQDLNAVGVNTNCMPLLDVPVDGAHDIIGQRAFAQSNQAVADLGRGFATGLMAAGIVPVGKHVPGHGRALADSHQELPRVTAQRDELEQSDFLPFRALSDLPAMMTAHVAFESIDPDTPASISKEVHSEIMRGAIGFDGLLISDDLSMAALDGPIARRALQVLAAGSDLALYCRADMADMEAVAEVVPKVEAGTRARLAACMSVTMTKRDPQEFTFEDAESARQLLMNPAS